jgi:multidrug transporter EmrE-like cation transporter
MPTPPEILPMSPPRRAPVRWHLQPYLHVALSIVFSAAAQPLLKLGADEVHAAASGGPAWLLPLRWLASAWIWLGIGAIIASLLSWLHALRTVPLTIAFNLSGFIHVLVPLASWAMLGERIGPLRAAGIALVVLGVIITAKEAVKLEEKL